jgi:Trk K+ transport system NAD-binding subunit
MAGEQRSADAGVRDVFGSPLRNLAVALAFVLAVFVASTAGFVAAGWPLGDALYMVTLTIFSVGYGEVRPIDTLHLRLLAIATIVLGCTGMIVLTGALVQVFASYQLRRLLGIDRMHNEIDRLSGHTIICGLGRIGHQLAKELARARSPLVIVEREGAKLAEARALGYLCLAGDATDEDALREAGIERARVLATVLPDDAANVFITLSARNLNPTLEIIARGEAPSTEGKLIHAGADRVVLPTHIGAERIAELILYPATASVVNDDARLLEMRRSMREFGLEVEVVSCDARGALTGKTVGEAERRGDGAFFVVQIERPGGPSIRHPGENVRVEAGDRLVLVLRGTRVSAGAIFAAPRTPIRMGRGYLK